MRDGTFQVPNERNTSILRFFVVGTPRPCPAIDLPTAERRPQPLFRLGIRFSLAGSCQPALVSVTSKAIGIVKLRGIIWLEPVQHKLLLKHAVQPVEAEEVLRREPHIRYVRTGHRRGEDVYAALGKTGAGRLLIVFFIRKLSADALIISAREMDAKERRYYERAKT